jgi:hypothetical protein
MLCCVQSAHAEGWGNAAGLSAAARRLRSAAPPALPGAAASLEPGGAARATATPCTAQGSEAARLAWARGGALLALCDARGGLALHDAATGGRLAVLDRHARGITCAGWGVGGCLALGGRDCQARAPGRSSSLAAPGRKAASGLHAGRSANLV